jgi:hypothetical protein
MSDIANVWQRSAGKSWYIRETKEIVLKIFLIGSREVGKVNATMQQS